ncbi:MAG: (Fe-S)-binding protein [Candidatus Hodarchaeales archaeon]
MIDKLAEKCVNCGSCLAVCPIFTARTREYLSPRGKVYFIQRMKDLDIQQDDEILDEFTKSLFSCTFCGYCDEVCKSEVKLLDIFAEGRKRGISRDIYPSMTRMIESVSSTGNIYAMDNDDRLDIWFDELEDEFPRLDDRIYREGKKADVGLFLGCVLSFRSNQLNILRSMIAILEAIGEDYLIYGNQEQCCGHPLHLTGDVELAANARESNMKLFTGSGIKKLVTNCPGCMVSFTKHYNLDGIILQHFTEYLEENWSKIEPLIERKGYLKEDEQENGDRLVYHDPCELSRICGVKEAPRNVLSAFTRFDDPEPRCCGGGGLLRMTEKDLATEVVEQRRRDTGEGKIVTCCPSCHEQFRSQSMDTVDIAELIATLIKKGRKEK